MMLDLLGPFPVLLMLLGSWEPVHPLCHCGQPSASVQTFILRHLRAGPLQCNDAMRLVNLSNRTCMRQNTFLHDTFRNVADTCGWPNRICRNGQDKCHLSANRINMTHCYHTGGRYPNCSYRTIPRQGLYTVACDPRQPGFDANCLFPVELD
uniref:Ribonuclease A-domain domain-containing protein n=2 Tax=Ailuropoda melanoleuca TaxID=9646 RepID=G1MMY6_AILME